MIKFKVVKVVLDKLLTLPLKGSSVSLSSVIEYSPPLPLDDIDAMEEIRSFGLLCSGADLSSNDSAFMPQLDVIVTSDPQLNGLVL
jgi:hypothetical protein